MPLVTVRPLWCPFPVVVHPEAEAVDRQTAAWSVRQGLLAESAVPDWLRAKIGWLAARIHPDARYDRLTIVSDWNAWLFLLDDYGDLTAGRSADHVERAMRRLWEILVDPGLPKADDGPFEQGLRDILLRIAACEPTACWKERFLEACMASSRAMQWEAENRARGRTPDQRDYAKMRLHTGAVETCLVLGELVDGFEVPPELAQDPQINALRDLANTIVCLQNDLYSLPKELEIDEIHNFVVLAQRRQGCSLQAAADSVADEHDEAVRRFVTLTEAALARDVNQESAVGQVVSLLSRWVRGNLDWSLETGRYAYERRG